jgi:hypothetical protein
LSPLRGSRGRRVLVLVVVAIALTVAASAARADGDPASDVLLTQDVFLPYSSPAPATEAELQQVVDGVYEHGDRIRVALIYEPTDLGSVGSLFGKPEDYAHFLSIELGLWYVGPLLVAMPAGFGFYDNGRPTADAEGVLQSIHVDAATPDALAQSATTAVERLAAADALRSPDVRAPLVTAHPASARLGKQATLHFDLFDDSGRTAAVVRVWERGALLATLNAPMQFAIGARPVGVRWRVPSKLASRQLRYCVVATDSAGNRSTPTCAPFIRVT